MLEHVALVVLAIANIILVLSAYFAQKEVLTKTHLNEALRQIIREWWAWDKVSGRTDRILTELGTQVNDHNFAMARIVAYLEKQGFKVNDAPGT